MYYNIFVTLFIIIIKSEVSTPLIVFIFSKVVSLRWLYHHSIILIIYIHIFICPGKSSFLSIVIVQSMMHANINIIHQSLKALFACLHITLCHYMMTSSNGNIFSITGPLCGELTSHWWIPPIKANDAELWCFLWSVPWINSWVNNREAGDLRCCRSHYDVIVMIIIMQTWIKVFNISNACQVYTVEFLSEVESIRSQLSLVQYKELCIFSVRISHVRTCILYLIIKLEVWTIGHCLRKDPEKMVCAERLVLMK